jgi:DNA-binding IclR family transcriptional regulator
MIQVIHRAFDILELIAQDAEQPKSLSEISNALKLNSGTCANIIKTMVDRRYIDKVANKKGFVLGVSAYNLVGGDAYKKKLVDIARIEMEALTGKLNENSELTILHENKRVVLLRISSDHDLQVRAASERIAYDTASGRMLLATLPEVEQLQFIEKYGLPSAEEWKEATTLPRLKKQLQQIMKDGYSIVNTSEQVIGIAVPLYKNGKRVAGLGVYMPLYRYEKYNKKAILKSILQSAKDISMRLQEI